MPRYAKGRRLEGDDQTTNGSDANHHEPAATNNTSSSILDESSRCQDTQPKRWFQRQVERGDVRFTITFILRPPESEMGAQ
jgi:hypothetical protein